MTRPAIIRADTIDLQDQNAPSAQDHTRKPTQPPPLGSGPPAPHQADTLREVAQEAREEIQRSPRVSKEWSNSEAQELQQYGDDLTTGVASKLSNGNLQKQDNLAIAQNGGLTGSTAEDADMADAEGDDGMDDDMMDKISSSPSIDDGGYSLSHLWSQRSDSLTRTSRVSAISQACCASSSPFVEPPDHFPMRLLPELDVAGVLQHSSSESHLHHHRPGEYPDEFDSESNYELSTEDNSLPRLDYVPPHVEENGKEYDYEQYYDLDQLAEYIHASNLEMLDEGVEVLEEQIIEKRDKRGNSPQGLPTIPYEPEDDDDDDFLLPYSADTRFVDSGWGGECLQNIEDIDFEFVYALHTFVATVEGQANATKGDTMVLLDDSNSYWWLVRVVKDSSIGYLPAEHIETPTERLARLNKHRNIDLTSAMLGDQAEKSRNPLKIAIRRRNAKTVTFTAPTYVEASDVDYSSDEDEGDGDFYGQNGQQEQAQEQRIEEEEVAAVEPLKTRSEIREVKSDGSEAEVKSGESTTKTSSEASRSSDEIFDGKVESKSRNGTVRNTDSFFKDDTVETRKITLTPNLLRDDSSTSTRTSNESKELKQRPSLDKIDKDSPEKNKDKKDKKEKKDKEKKGGMLSGLFKRKEKKAKAIDDEIEEILTGKRSTSTEKDRSSPVPSKDSEDAMGTEEQAANHTPTQSFESQRQPSKLQKQPRQDVSPSQKAGQVREAKLSDPQRTVTPDRAAPAVTTQAPSMRLVQPEAAESQEQTRIVSPEISRGPTSILTTSKEPKSAGAISKILRSNSEPRPIKAKRGKARVELDDFDSSSEDSSIDEPTRAPSKQAVRPIPGSFPESYIGTPADERSNAVEDRLSESPVHVSPVTSQPYPPALMVDTSSQEDPPSPVSSPSPDLIDVDDAQDKKTESSTTSTSTPTWSDAHLRTFFDDDADIKDLLVVVYDKSGVVPAGPDHPITGNLFREENAKLADITSRLDGMLGDWLARKMRTQSSR